MWSQRDPSIRKSGKGNIFIKNLDKSIDHKALYDTFSQFGNIVSCKVELDKNGESKGYGYIQFATQDAAEKAIAKVNGMMLKDKKVFVGQFVSRKERVASSKSVSFTNAFVKNLPEEVTEEELTKLFSKFGAIKSCVIMKDESGKSKGFGFVNLGTVEEAQAAVDELNNSEYHGKTIYVGRAQKKAEREVELKSKFDQMKQEQLAKYQGVNLYIKNLDDDVDEDKLRSLFTPFGTITSCKIMKDGRGNSKGFGFVCYASPEEATKAVTEMNGKIIQAKPLYVALAQRKEVRKAQLEAQFAQRKMVPAMYGAPTGPAAMFYPPGQPGFVYGAQMMPRGRFPPYPSVPANYVVVGRGNQMKNGRGGMNVQGVPPNARRGRGGPMGGVPMGGVPIAAHGGLPMAIPTPNAVIPPNALAQLAPQPVDKLTSAYLNQFRPEEQKNLLGERLYPLISKKEATLAGKITGMILESCNNDEILQMLENNDILSEKIDEAVKVINQFTEETNE